jgi:hypothetical protein
MSASAEYDVSTPLAPRRAAAVVTAANLSKRYSLGGVQANKRTGKEKAVTTTAARMTVREARPRRLISTLLWAAQIWLAAFSCSLQPCPS